MANVLHKFTLLYQKSQKTVMKILYIIIFLYLLRIGVAIQRDNRASASWLPSEGHIGRQQASSAIEASLAADVTSVDGWRIFRKGTCGWFAGNDEARPDLANPADWKEKFPALAV